MYQLPNFTHEVFISANIPSHFVFSGGEVHCKHPMNLANGVLGIWCRDYTAEGFMAACMHNEIARRQGAAKVHLILPYVPYARQDRVMQDNEPFSLRVFADLLNSQGFDSVVMCDPHSDVAPALIRNSVVINQWEIAERVIGEFVNDGTSLFVSPDAGAYKKLSKLIKDDSRVVIATKERGPDGNIVRTRLLNADELSGKNVIIVDDICDGGRTFVELAKSIRSLMPARLILYVTHGIFSNGFGDLNTYFDHIYTTTSFPSKEPNQLVTRKEIF